VLRTTHDDHLYMRTWISLSCYALAAKMGALSKATVPLFVFHAPSSKTVHFRGMINWSLSKANRKPHAGSWTHRQRGRYLWPSEVDKTSL